MNEAEPHDLHAEIERLRLRLDEQGAIVKRTNAVVTALADSVGQVVAAQRRRERGVNLNSFVAYLLFTVLLGGAFLVLYDTRSDELLDARDRAYAERDEHRTRADELQGSIAARDQAAAVAAREAGAYYELLEQGRRAEVVQQFGAVEKLALTDVERAMFAAGERTARAALVDAGYAAGLASFKARDHAKAITELTRALGYEGTGPRAAQMRYYLGISQYRVGEHEAAADALAAAIAERVDQAGVTDARYYLGAALEALGRVDEARAAYDEFVAAQPQHPLSVYARRKSAMLAHKRATTN